LPVQQHRGGAASPVFQQDKRTEPEDEDIGMSSRTRIAALAAALVGAASLLPAPLLAQTAEPRATPDRAIAGPDDARAAAVKTNRRASTVEESADRQPAAGKAATSATSSK
jgi:hypothetical protein